MAKFLNEIAIEKSSFVVTLNFKDDNGDAIAPDTATWTLSDPSGNIINSRNQVSISAPGATEQIVLQGDDLAMQTSLKEENRTLTVEATMTIGAGSVTVKEAVLFKVQGLTVIS